MPKSGFKCRATAGYEDMSATPKYHPSRGPALPGVHVGFYNSRRLPDLVMLVGITHSTEPRNVVGESIPVPWREAVVVQHVLNRGYRVVQVSLVKARLAPMLREFAKLFLGMIQTIAIGFRKMPYAIGMVQIVVDAIDQCAYVAWTVAAFSSELSDRGRR